MTHEIIYAIKQNNKKKKNQGKKCDTRSLNKFPGFFLMGTFIDSTHMKL